MHGWIHGWMDASAAITLQGFERPDGDWAPTKEQISAAAQRWGQSWWPWARGRFPFGALVRRKKSPHAKPGRVVDIRQKNGRVIVQWPIQQDGQYLRRHDPDSIYVIEDGDATEDEIAEFSD